MPKERRPDTEKKTAKRFVLALWKGRGGMSCGSFKKGGRRTRGRSDLPTVGVQIMKD